MLTSFSVEKHIRNNCTLNFTGFVKTEEKEKRKTVRNSWRFHQLKTHIIYTAVRSLKALAKRNRSL